MKKIFILTLFFYVNTGIAGINHELIRRIVVFPFQSNIDSQKEAEESWWKVRETLTNGKRFLVASKDFLERKDVFQARGELSPADAIILGELLDAQLVITGVLKNKSLTLYAYESIRGQLVWSYTTNMHASLPLSEQIEKASEETASLLIADIPYHGFVVKDEIIGQTVFKRNNQVLVKIEISTLASVGIGDEIQWIKVFNQNLKPLFQGGANIEIFADGKVIEVHDGYILAEVKRVTDINHITVGSLIRLPSELKRFKELYALKDSIKRRINPDYFSPEISEIHQEAQETQPLLTALSFLVNIVTILLIAF
ncbi:MAG: hypothetical protein KDD58_05000 [Bdellovibrionales bacterium]|nr:hypothetical protein [Bdellovibrionales bacterium]MCB0512781.1 hypothetical protein [Bacteroidota bacterium]